MPLTKTGKRVMKNFQKEYGKDEGKRIFYAYTNARKELKKDLHKSNKSK